MVSYVVGAVAAVTVMHVRIVLTLSLSVHSFMRLYANGTN